MQAKAIDAKKGTRTLFSNPILEKLTRTHISVPITLLTLYAGALLYWSIAHTSLNTLTTIGMFVLGVVLFTWVEYLVHRFVFHMATYNAVRVKWQYMIHGVHHEYPKDKDRLAMPPVLSVTISTLLLLLCRLVLGDMAFSFLPGFLVGYSIYLGIHYMVHAFPPPKNFTRWLWINHSIHHYKDGDLAFGVTSPLWDHVYGTTGTRKPGEGAVRPHHHHH